jgi:predicted  nucleic acid-binding Zn-ribbon protein
MPLQRKNLEAQLAASVAALEAVKHKARQVEIDRKNLELDVGTRQQSIARLRTQQYETRKNDEFQAIGHEIQRYEKEIAAIEDQELELMDQADKLKLQVAEEDKKAAAAKDSISRQLKDLDEKSKTLDSRLAELKKEREQLAHSIDEDLLDRFDRLFASKGDAAVVALEHDVCTGCHMRVTTATANLVRAGKEIVSCEQCGRILYDAT